VKTAERGPGAGPEKKLHNLIAFFGPGLTMAAPLEARFDFAGVAG
jgi:hypothetical protein